MWWCSVPVSGGGRPGGSFCSGLSLGPFSTSTLYAIEAPCLAADWGWAPKASMVTGSKSTCFAGSGSSVRGAHPDVLAHPHFLDRFARNASSISGASTTLWRGIGDRPRPEGQVITVHRMVCVAWGGLNMQGEDSTMEWRPRFSLKPELSDSDGPPWKRGPGLPFRLTQNSNPSRCVVAPPPLWVIWPSKPARGAALREGDRRQRWRS